MYAALPHFDALVGKTQSCFLFLTIIASDFANPKKVSL
jgi:hypothetical protein